MKLVACLVVLLVAGVWAAPNPTQNGFATVSFNLNCGGGLVLPTENLRVDVCGITSGVSSDNVVTYTVPVSSVGTPCTVQVSESASATVRRNFTLFPGSAVTWSDLTATLAINIEHWNPWCFEDCLNNGNAPLIQLNADGVQFREYSNKPAACGSSTFNRLPLNRLPPTTPGNWLTQCGAANTYTAPFNVCVLRTLQEVRVSVAEYSRAVAASVVPGVCLQDLVRVTGHNGFGWTGAVPTNVTRTVDANVSDGVGNSGLLIARLQIPSYCWEPTVQTTLGVNGYPNSVAPGLTQFPVTQIWLTWQPTPAGPAISNVRWSNGRDSQFAQNSLNTWWVLAVNNYQITAARDKLFPTAPYPKSCTIPSDTQVKQPTAACFNGTCEAQPISSTLYIDLQGHCSDLLRINVIQPWFNQTGSSTLLDSTYAFSCSQLVDGRLPVCVFNLPNTQVRAFYRTTNLPSSSAPASFGVSVPAVNCQVGGQKCISAGGIIQVCPNLGCLPGVDGPTELNYLVTTRVGTADVGLFYGRGAINSVLGMSPAAPGCFWVPYSETPITVTLAEGCCTLTATGTSPASYGFTGIGCVQHSQTRTGCTPSFCNQTTGVCTYGDCSPTASFGRTLSAFDLNYLPENSESTVSVALEDANCDAFRFKTHQGGAPRCYCVLPIYVRARISEKSLVEDAGSRPGSGAESCHCTDLENCVADVRQLDNPNVLHADADCTLCEFSSDLFFDLTGLPTATLVQLKTGDTGVTPGVLRTRTYQGGRMLAYNVLRSHRLPATVNEGSQPNTPANCCHNQVYCVLVRDAAATLELCTTCGAKTCTPGLFTRDLRLNLTSPCTDSSEIRNRLTVAIHTASPTPSPDVNAPPGTSATLVRLVENQGGVDGCTAVARDAAPTLLRSYDDVRREAELRLRSEHDTSHMSDDELLDHEVDVARRAEHDARGLLNVNQRPSVYTVLRNQDYAVGVWEQSVGILRVNVPCARTIDSCSWCSGIINCLCVNSTCGGHAINPDTGLNGGAINSTNTHFSLYNRFFAAGPRQIRGTRGRWIQVVKTCRWQAPTFVAPTYFGYGNRNWCFPIINSASNGLFVEEGLIAPANIIYPDPRPHPNVLWGSSTCYSGSITAPITSTNYCRVLPQEIFSLWMVASARGIPQPDPFLFLKYGNPQGLFRQIPADRLAWGSGLENDTSTWKVGVNFICVVADPTLNYLLNWGVFAVPNSPAFNRTHCPANLLPVYHPVLSYISEFNLCGQCNPNAVGGELFDDGCRTASIVPGSDSTVRLPLGTIIGQVF